VLEPGGIGADDVGASEHRHYAMAVEGVHGDQRDVRGGPPDPVEGVSVDQQYPDEASRLMKR